MAVRIEPANQLAFRRPLTRLVSENLSVLNQQTDAHVAFKVKTTAPKQYCVRPNSGKIKPGETVQVQVLLQPLKEDPAKDFKCRDKFLVQSVVIPPEHMSLSLSDLWTIVERDARDTISEQKVRCVFLPEDTDADKKAGDSKGEHHTEDGGGSPPEYKETNQDPNAGSSQIPLQNSAGVPSGSGFSGSSMDSTPTETEAALRRQLALAQEQIEALRKQSSELRQRRPDTGNSGSVAGKVGGGNVAQATKETFSVQIVALVALISFLCGYIFF